MPFPWSAPASWLSLAAWHRQQHQPEPGRCGRERTPGAPALAVMRSHPWDPAVPVPSPSAPQSLGGLGHPGLSAGAVHKGKGCQGHGLEQGYGVCAGSSGLTLLKLFFEV